MKEYQSEKKQEKTIENYNICFHQVCGRNIILSNRQCKAQRNKDSYCDGIVFSDRPVGIQECIYIKIIKLSSVWNGMIRFGYTTDNPDFLKNNLPKYIYPDLTNKKGLTYNKNNNKLF